MLIHQDRHKISGQLPMLVLSVHCNNKWFDLQYEFLTKTTNNFELAVCLNNTQCSNSNIRVIANRSTKQQGTTQHLEGLNVLADFAKINQNKYRSFLILDSDCFPIIKWEDTLSNAMQKSSKTCACAIRTENLTQHLHPMIVYTSNANNLEFRRGNITTALGDYCQDPSFVYNRKKVFPLIRTNKLNLHPLAFGIYFDLFYHHAAGSRHKDFRINLYTNRKIPAKLDTIFWADPNKFIHNLKNIDIHIG